jgi:hypothetical protein
MSEERDYERPTLHPNAPLKLRQKAQRQKRQATIKERLASIPTSIHAARHLYLAFCAGDGVDLDLEMQEIVDGLQAIVGERAMRGAR